MLAATNGAAYLRGLDLLARQQSGAWQYPLPDALGSVWHLTNPMGQVTQSYRANLHREHPYCGQVAGSGFSETTTLQWEVPVEMIDPNRLVKPRDKFREGFPELDFREVYSFHTSGQAVLVTDPVYLADVYNSKDEMASFLRAQGVFIMDFGGDVSSPVWWQHPFVLLPISMHLSNEDLEPPEEVTVLAREVGTDSGSFVFLPLTKDLSSALKAQVDKVLAKNNGTLLELSAGNWSVFYEQWDAPEERLNSLYRNIVLRWEPNDSQSELE